MDVNESIKKNNREKTFYDRYIEKCYLPNKYLISELGLILNQNEYGEWVDSKGNIAFIDPSTKQIGPSYALIRSDLLNAWLIENNLQLIWLNGGEKQLFTSMASEFFGRLIYSGIYTMKEKGVDGEMWVSHFEIKGDLSTFLHLSMFGKIPE